VCVGTTHFKTSYHEISHATRLLTTLFIVMDEHKSISVQGVRNTKERNARHVRGHDKCGLIEIKLDFQEGEVTNTLRHKDIFTVICCNEVSLRKNFEFLSSAPVVSKYKLQGDPKCPTKFLLDNYSVTMDMNVRYYYHANVKATSTVITSVSEFEEV